MAQMHRKRVGVGLMAALVGLAFAEGCVLLTHTELPSSDTDSGNAGGSGGGGGSGAAGAGGGPSSGERACLAPGAAADLFTIADPSFCVVAIYSAATSGGLGTPTWGSHGGPLMRSHENGSSAVDLVRFHLPAGATGELRAETTHVEAMIPADAFVGDQALDLPFFGWTALSWAGAYPKTDGEILLIKGAAVAKRYAMNGPFSLAAVAADSDHGRLLSSSRSALGDATGDKTGLYAADSCGTTAAPDLLPGQDPTCAPPLAVATWGDASGPVVTDRDGNVFAVMTAFAGPQEARAFPAPAIARGEGPAAGAQLFTLPGFGSSLAAIAPAAALPGVVLFQPFNPTSYQAEDVIAQGYRASADSITPDGAPRAFLELAEANTSVTLMRDDQDRVWVGVGSTFVVIARSP